jgi:Lipocalin-like domain
MKKNNVAGCWKLISAYINNHGIRIDFLGSHPNGMLIFTEDLHFIGIFNNPDIPKFASGDRSNGTFEEYKTAVTNSLGVYGTYTVDENGDFLEQLILGSTDRHLNDRVIGRDELTEKVEGNRMMEKMKIAEKVTEHIIWERVQ